MSNPADPSLAARGLPWQPPPGPDDITLAEALELEAQGHGRVRFRDGVGHWETWRDVAMRRTPVDGGAP